jgi:hypothetical protein
MQHGQGFFVIQYHMSTTSGLSAAGPKVATFSLHLAKFKQLLIDDLTTTR